jgi:predicted nucleotidyltransferase/HEPN domain-containing protein
MKTSHLPISKQKELELIVQTIRNSCDDIEKIILFGSYARGDYKEKKDLKPDRKSGHVSDYDILVVTSKKEVALNLTLWRKIEKECKNLGLSATVKILTHDIEALNIKLAEGQYFFSDVKKEGIVLFDSGKFDFVKERELTAKEKQRIAKDYFEHWFKSAKTFFSQYENAVRIDDYKNAAFQLHQVAESCYKTILLVFTNYSPQEHFLEYLAEECEEFSEELKTIFPKITEEDEDRFKLLEYAYIGGRYDPEYQILKEDLELLAIDVKKLLGIAKKVCEERIG